jgi:hypothetical protein
MPALTDMQNNEPAWNVECSCSSAKAARKIRSIRKTSSPVEYCEFCEFCEATFGVSNVAPADSERLSVRNAV